MSTAIPSTVGTPPTMQPNQVFTQAELQAHQAQQAQNLFRQKQLLAQQERLQLHLQAQMQGQQNPQQQQQQQQQAHQQQLHLQQQQQSQQQFIQQQQQQQQQQLLHQQQVLQQNTPFPQHHSQPQTPQLTTQAGTPVMSSPASVMTTSKIPAVPRNQSNGEAVLRLLQFAEQLNPGGDQATDRLFWDAFVDNFFSNTSTMKMSLYNMEENAQQPYEVGQALIARLFHTQYMCGMVSLQMTLEQTMEYLLPGGLMNVECPRASLINRFNNGSLVVSTGYLWVQFIKLPDGNLKIGHMDFSCQGHEEYVTRGSIKVETKKKQSTVHLSESPINKWGVPPRVLHILQIADIGPRLSEVVFHSLVSETTPRQSLNAIAFDKRQELLNHGKYTASPIVRTQNGAQGQQAFQYQPHGAQPPTYQAQPAYPNQFNQQSPVARKRNSIASDIQSPVARKKAATPSSRKQQQQQ